jgi:hypothetical protein
LFGRLPLPPCCSDDDCERVCVCVHSMASKYRVCGAERDDAVRRQKKKLRSVIVRVLVFVQRAHEELVAALRLDAGSRPGGEGVTNLSMVTALFGTVRMRLIERPL